MPFIEWTETNKTNVKICDDQHKKLFSIVNRLYDAMKRGEGKDILGQILSELLAYTSYHFSTEEALMQQYSFPELPHHKKEHIDLKTKAKDLYERFEKGEFTLSLEVLNFLKGWLMNHTIGTDRKYGEFLNKKGVF